MNNELLNQKMDRKTFLIALGRYLILGATTLLCISLFFNRRKSDNASKTFEFMDSTCGRTGICKDCRKFTRCGHPSALSYRNHLQRSSK